MVCTEHDSWALESRTAHSALLARQWWQRTWGTVIDTAADNRARAGIRTEALADKVARVASGELAFSRNDVLRHELVTLLREIEWDRRRWKPLPQGVASAPGRRWGSRGAKIKAEALLYTAHVHVDTSDEVAELIRRGCYWSSEQATAALQRWYDRHGRGPAHASDLPEGVRGLYMLVTLMNPLTEEQLEERDGWRAMVITPGDLLRTVVARAGQGYEPQGKPEDYAD